MNIDEMKTQILDCMGTSPLSGESIWRRCGSPQEESFLLDSALVQLQKDPRIRMSSASNGVLLYQYVG